MNRQTYCVVVVNRMGIWPIVRFEIFMLYSKIIQLYDYVYLTLHQTVAVGRKRLT